MIDLSKISDYLPKHLTDSSYKEFREAVKRFPEIAYDQFYSSYGIDPLTIYQGDCILGLPFYFGGNFIKSAKCFVLSNTCDMDVSGNTRYFNSRVVFAPIVDAKLYVESLRKNHSTEVVDGVFESIKRQLTSQIMYLPPNESIKNGGLVFLDHLYNVLSKDIPRKGLENNRLFSLSNYGHYCMCIKLSHHFCRVTAEVDKPNSLPNS